MSLLPVGIGGARSGYEIEKSLRFRASASAYLSRTFGSPTDATKWSYSLWVKRGALGSTQDLLSASTDIAISLRDTSAISIYKGGTGYVATSAALLRDVASHYHILMTKNGSDLIVYVNGESVLTYTGAFANVNTATAHTIGKYQSAAVDFFDGYMSEINFIDGQALDPSYFGKADPATGQWVPKKYTGTYGTNGFYLDFKDGTSLTTLGYDKSGNSNDWTLNNISLTAGVTYDWMDDTPSNNFAVLNSLQNRSLTLSNAGLATTSANAFAAAMASMSFSAGKWYWEVTVPTTYSTQGHGWGITLNPVGTAAGSSYPGSQAYEYVTYQSNGNKYNNASNSAYGTGALTAGDVVMVAVDADAKKVWWGKNGTWFSSGDPVAGSGEGYTFSSGEVTPLSGHMTTLAGYATTSHINFGQRPFAYTPPIGFKALCTKNLPAPQVKNGAGYFDVVLDSGANIKTACEALYGIFFEWIKDRANTNNHQLVDSVRGNTAVLQSNAAADETTYSAPSGSSVGWVWRIAAGFLDVVTYTGTGVARTVAHNLGVAPAMVVVKARTTAGADQGWPVYHQANTAAPATDYLLLNSTAATADLDTVWNDTPPASSELTVGTGALVNTSGDAYVAYLFAEVEGFSKFGTYTGNGSANGPFVWCGFKPKFLMVKCTSTTGDWWIYDAERSPANPAVLKLLANTNGVEDVAGEDVDLLSNGFKICSTAAGQNANAATYIFAAFAECAQKYSNAR